MLFALPLDESIAKGLGLQLGDFEGLVIGMKPEPDMLAKFESGELTGFSLGGSALEIEEVEDAQGCRTLKRFRITEVSGVSSPAQQNARIAIFKSVDDGVSKQTPTTGGDPDKGNDDGGAHRREVLAALRKSQADLLALIESDKGEEALAKHAKLVTDCRGRIRRPGEAVSGPAQRLVREGI